MPAVQNRRRLLVLADQSASSLSNVVVAVVVARSFPGETEQFAAFGLSMLAFQFIVGCVRGLLFEPPLSLHAERPRERRAQMLPGYLGATLLVGAAIAGLVAAIAVTVGGMAGSALLALAATLPFVLVQDAWRYFFLVDRPHAALAVDLVWLATSLSIIVALPAGQSIGRYVLAWGVGGAIGAVLATVVERRSIEGLRAWSYVRDHGALGWRFLSEYLMTQTGNYAALLTSGLLLGLSAYGALRAGNLYLGPLLTLQAAVILAALPEAARLRDQPDRLVRLIAGAAAIVAVPTLAWTTVGILVPESFGRSVFGATWAETRRVLLPMGVAQTAVAFAAAGLVGVRALDGTKGIGAQIRSAPFLLVCPITGAVVGGLVGFGVGLVLGQTITAAIWFSTFRRLLAQRRKPPAANGQVAPSGRPSDEGRPKAVVVDDA
jgi:hypothetical protein